MLFAESLIVAALLLPRWTTAGLIIGLGSNPGFPPCANSCCRALAEYRLTCSTNDTYSNYGLEASYITEPNCYASNTPYLTTLAWCVQTHCASYDLSAADYDKFWSGPVTANPGSGVDGEPILATPKWSYTETLQQIVEPPTQYLAPQGLLNETLLVSNASYSLQYNTDIGAIYNAGIQAKLSLPLLVVGLAVPILLSWLKLLPGVHHLVDRVRPYLLYPPSFGRHHHVPHPRVRGSIPTVGQSLYITGMFALTIILSGPGYWLPGWPNQLGPDTWWAILELVVERFGSLAYAILPIVMLFAGRNNILLWLTDWSHSTYLLYHRWIARIWGLLAILHSILGLAFFVRVGEYNVSEGWWAWGIVATVATVVLLIASGRHIRQWSYSAFLALHVVMAVMTIVGCWYHVWISPYGIGRYYNASQDWLYISIAIWAVDRFLRLGRILRNGIHYALVTEVGTDHIRLDIKGIRWDAVPGKHIYVHFPTLRPFTPWDNHPFSWVSTPLLHSYRHTVRDEPEQGWRDPTNLPGERQRHDTDCEKIMSAEDSSSPGESSSDMSQPTEPLEKGLHLPVAKTHFPNDVSGITLFIKKSKGTTKLLKANASLLTLLDGPYRNNDYKSTLRTDRLLLIGGGVGVSGLLPWLGTHPNIKLFWTVRTEHEDLVRSLDTALSGLAEKDIRVGSRLSITDILVSEAALGWRKIGVVACGPPSMCDDIRVAVFQAGKGSATQFELEVDAYSW